MRAAYYIAPFDGKGCEPVSTPDVASGAGPVHTQALQSGHLGECRNSDRPRGRSLKMPSDHPRDDQRPDVPHDEKPSGVSVASAPSEYQTALLQIIESTTNDPRKLRKLVYELARMNLKKESWQRRPSLTSAEVKECMHALETAISRVETDSSHGDATDVQLPRLESDPERLVDSARTEIADLRTPRLERDHSAASEPSRVVHRLSTSPQPAIGVPAPIKREHFARRTELTPRGRFPLHTESKPGLPAVVVPTPAAGAHAPAPQVEIVYPNQREEPDNVRVRRRVWFWFIVWPLLQLAGPAVFTVALYAALSGRIDFRSAQTQQAIEQKTSIEDAAKPQPSGLPLPATYGVYAISNGALNELEALPVKPPDPRVSLSAEINKPSTTILPDGKIVFVIFRRELVNAAPQKLNVRVVAQVARAMTIMAGKAITTNVEGIWRIRNNSFEFKVSPLNENREMVQIRSDTPDFTFAPGRYVLVFNSLAYDFTVDGPTQSPAHCLESFEAANGPIFTECRPK
jgi:hypothetical protein